jgi:hypothetical protein
MVCEDVINCELEGQGREESRLITRCYANIRLVSLSRGVNVGTSKDLTMCVDLSFMAVRIQCRVYVVSKRSEFLMVVMAMRRLCASIFICSLFNDAFSTHYVASNERMISER